MSASRPVRVASWNVEWAPPVRYERVEAKLRAVDADVFVITEGLVGLLPQHGHLIDAGDDWGQPDRGDKPDRRKVLAWSKHPWRDVRLVDDGAAKGRMLGAITDTDDGPVRVIAVCISWEAANVSTGRKDRSVWQDNVECCEQLRAFRRTFDADEPTLIAGDYNQRIPKTRQPQRASAALDAALEGMTVWTGGDTAYGQLIDHVAGSARFVAEGREVWSKQDADGLLSDHSGVACDVRRAPAAA